MDTPFPPLAKEEIRIFHSRTFPARGMNIEEQQQLFFDVIDPGVSLRPNRTGNVQSELILLGTLPNRIDVNSVPPNSDEYQGIKTFFDDGMDIAKGPTPQCERNSTTFEPDSYSTTVSAIYRVERLAEAARHQEHSDDTDGHCRLLWHGTPAKKIMSILGNGLRPGKYQPKTKKGIFFAHRSKTRLVTQAFHFRI